MGRSQVPAEPPVVVVAKRASCILLPGPRLSLSFRAFWKLLIILSNSVACPSGGRYIIWLTLCLLLIDFISALKACHGFARLGESGVSTGSGCTVVSHTRPTCAAAPHTRHACAAAPHTGTHVQWHHTPGTRAAAPHTRHTCVALSEAWDGRMNIIMDLLLTIRLRHGEIKCVPKRHRADLSAGAKKPDAGFLVPGL